MLFVAGIEDDGPILRARIVPLPIQRGRIMDGEEDLEQIGEADLRRIEGDADDLHVTGVAGADLPIGGIRSASTHVAGFDRGHALQAIEDRFQTPETSATEHCGFAVSHAE